MIGFKLKFVVKILVYNIEYDWILKDKIWINF